MSRSLYTMKWRQDTIASIGLYDWAISALFYSALNLLQAYFIEQELGALTHAARRRVIAERADLRSIANTYNHLKNLSEASRYDCVRYTSDEFESAKHGSYEAVMSHLRQLQGTA